LRKQLVEADWMPARTPSAGTCTIANHHRPGSLSLLVGPTPEGVGLALSGFDHRGGDGFEKTPSDSPTAGGVSTSS
jgi:hypothetical protein